MRRTLQVASSLALRPRPPLRRAAWGPGPRRAGVVRGRNDLLGDAPRPHYKIRGLSSSSAATAPASSNAFWASLHESVREGDGIRAEELVNGLLSGGSSSTIDPRVGSLVLEAWKNSAHPEAPRRSLRLLERMIALADEGVLREPPSADDFHAVLECYQHQQQQQHDPRAAESVLRVAGLMAAAHHPLPSRARSLTMSVLAHGGHVRKALRFLEEQPSPPSHNHDDGEDPSSTAPSPQQHSLELHNYLLLAYARSRHHHPAAAAEEAHALLQRMRRGEHGLPSPDGTSYDLVLECWHAASRSHRTPPPRTRRRQRHHPRNDDDPARAAGQHALRLLEQMKEDQCRTTLGSYQSAISILAESGEAEQAEHLLSNLIKDYGAQFDADLKPGLEPFRTVLGAYSRCFHPDAAKRASSILLHTRELYESGVLDTQPDAYSYNLVLKCWMHAKDPAAPQKALGLLDEMRRGGILPDTTTLNTVLHTLAKHASSPAAVEDRLREFLAKHLGDPSEHPRPDVVSFGTVLTAWAHSGDPSAWERAEALLADLQSLWCDRGWDRCQPDLAIYSSVMKCYAKSGEADAPQKSEALLRSIQREAAAARTTGGAPPPGPDTVCWNMAIYAWARAGNGERAEALFREMLAEHTNAKAEATAAPNSVTFSAVLSAWARTRDDPRAPDRAEALLRTMEALHKDGSLPDAKPNVVNYSIVLDCLAYAKTTAAAVRAEELLREMKASHDEDVAPNVVSYNSVIKAWSLSRDPSAVPRITALLTELLRAAEAGNRRMIPNANTFGSVLKALADSNLPDKEKRAEVVVNLMEKFGIEWNSWSRKQLRRCSAPSKKNAGGSRGRRGGKGASAVPEIPSLEYSS